MKALAGRAFVSVLVIIASAPFVVVNAWAGGFGIYTQGAASLAQADAVIAHAEGPETIFFNPALLNRLPDTQVELGTTAVFASRKYTSSLSGNEDSPNQSFFPSTFYVSHRVNDKISFGFGIFSPFGLGTDWGTDWQGRFLATKSKMTTFAFNPSILSAWVTSRFACSISLSKAITLFKGNNTFMASRWVWP